MEPDANRESGAPITVDQAAKALSGLLGSDKANPEPEQRPARQAAQEPQAEPAGEPDEGDDPGEAEAFDEDPESEAEDGAGDDQPEELRYSVTVAGKEQEVTLDELRAGYQRESDYRRKTMGLAEERKATQAQREALAEQGRQLAARLTELNTLMPELPAPDPSLAESDPGEYIRQQAQYEARRRDRQRLESERDRLLSEAQKRQQQQHAEFLSEQRDLLLKAMPEWRKPEVAAKEKDALVSYATSTAGFSAEEVAGLADHRALVVLRKAMLYDKLQSKKPELIKKVQEAPKLIRPGKGKSSSEQQRERSVAMRQQLARTGDRDIAAKLISQKLKMN